MLTSRSLAAVAAVALAACGPSIQFDRDDSVPIPAGATFTYPPEDHSNDPQVDPTQSNTIVQGRIQRAIDAELTKKGYKRVFDYDQAEFVVRYFWSVRRDTQLMTQTVPMGGPMMMGPGMGMGMGMGPGMGMGWGWGWGGGFATTTVPVSVTEGTFLLDLIDKDTRKLAWRATWVGEPKGRAPTQAELNDGAADLLAKAPKAR
jgi:hypothetical protein